jgi:pimeloyl-ACP methyl ester carboxylesterase
MFNLDSILNKSIIPASTIVDIEKRVKLNESLWESLIHFDKKHKLDGQILRHVRTSFQDHYGIRDKEFFLHIWNKIGAKVWTPKTVLTAGIIRDIDDKFRKELIYHGEGIKPPERELPINQTVQKLVQALLHGGDFSPLEVEDHEVKAIFSQHDEDMMKQFQLELQLEMDHLVAKPPIDKEQEFIWRAFLGNVLAIIPYSYPTTGTVFKIPILENGNCRQVEYHTEVINLIYEDHLSPMTVLAMTPINDTNAPPILSFIGTTFPAGAGFVSTLLADFTPGNSVGEIVYKRNHEKIDQWLANKTGVHVVGMSLGGAMALHTVRHHHDIGRVDVYNPPGLYAKNWENGVGTTCEVNIFCQPNDIVSQLGEWPTSDNVSLYTVYPYQNDLPKDPLNSHARAFTGCKNITVIKEDPFVENESFFRSLLTTLHWYVAPFVIFMPLSAIIILYRIANAVRQVSASYFNRLSNAFTDELSL